MPVGDRNILVKFENECKYKDMRKKYRNNHYNPVLLVALWNKDYYQKIRDSKKRRKRESRNAKLNCLNLHKGELIQIKSKDVFYVRDQHKYNIYGVEFLSPTEDYHTFNDSKLYPEMIKIAKSGNIKNRFEKWLISKFLLIQNL